MKTAQDLIEQWKELYNFGIKPLVEEDLFKEGYTKLSLLRNHVNMHLDKIKPYHSARMFYFSLEEFHESLEKKTSDYRTAQRDFETFLAQLSLAIQSDNVFSQYR